MTVGSGFPKRSPRRAKPGESDRGRIALAEPLCIAAANVPKFPRQHLRTINNTPARLTTRPPTNLVGCHLQALSPQIRTTSNAQTPGCLLYGRPSSTAISRHTRRPLAHCAAPAIEPPLTSLQTLKTRRKKNVKKGIQFCLMVCGASGTGRTTFVNTLCGKKVLEHKESDDPTVAHQEEGVKIQPITVGMWPRRLSVQRSWAQPC